MNCCVVDTRGKPHDHERGCHDVPCLVLLVLFSIGMFTVCGLAIQEGDLKYLEHGTDHEGRVCGQGSPPPGVSDDEWKKRVFLWFPADNTADLALCIEKCPHYDASMSYMVKGYSGEIRVTYATRSSYERCIPITWTSSKPSPTSYMLIKKTAFQAAVEINKSTKVFAIACGTAFVLSHTWVSLAAFVPGTTFLLLVMSYVVTFLLFVVFGVAAYEFSSEVPGIDADFDHSLFWEAVSYMMFVFSFFYLLLGCHLLSYLPIACIILNEISKMITNLVLVLILPFLTLMVLLPSSILCIEGALHLATVVSTVDKHLEADPMLDLIWYLLIGWCWWVAFLLGFLYVAVCYCMVFWYFEGPVSSPRVSQSTFAVMHAVWWTFRYHMGSIACGSVIIMFVQPLRTVFRPFEGLLRSAGGAMCGCCLNCYLGFLDKVLHPYSKSTYALQCILGVDPPPNTPDLACCGAFLNGYIRAAGFARSSYFKRLPGIAIVNFKSDVLLVSGKMAACSVSCVLTWQLLRQDSIATTETTTFPFILSVIVAYVICSAVFSLFMAALDALIVCYAFDTIWPSTVAHMSDDLYPLRGSVLPTKIDLRSNSTTTLKTTTAFNQSNEMVSMDGKQEHL